MLEFFADGHIPHNSASFLAAFSTSSERERLALRALIRDFTPEQIYDYACSILDHASDERLLAMTFIAPDVVEKMDVDLLEHHFRTLYRMKRMDRISAAFFEQCAAGLVLYGNPLLKVNFLGVIHSVIENYGMFKNHTVEALQGTVFDQAVAANLEEIFQQFVTPDDFSYCTNGLVCFDLPITLGVLLKNRIAAGEAEMANSFVSRLFTEDKLTSSYIDTCRHTLGDEAFVAVCQGEMQKALRGGQQNYTRVCSVAKLAPIFGEASFHSPTFLEHLFKEDGEGHVPRYISSLNAHGFYAFDLPVIRGFMIENLDRLVLFKPSYGNELAMVRDLISLAHVEGAGARALKLLLQRMGDLIGGEAFDDPFAVLIESLFDASVPTERSRGNALLHHVVEAVGLKTLQEVVPDVGTNFLSEFIETKKPAMSEVEVMRLFPQMKGTLLEDYLGL